MGYWEEMQLRLMELEEELEASGIEDATTWEKFPEMERIMYEIAEHEAFMAAYPREQYEQDRAKLIAEGVNPRCIMSYSETIAHNEWKAERERDEMYEDDWGMSDEDYEQMLADIAEYERECAITAEVAERDEIIEMAEMAEESALAELEAFGCIELRHQFDWSRAATPDEYGSMAAIVAICADEYLPCELY